MSRVPGHRRRQIAELSLQVYTQRAISSMTNRPLKTVNRTVQAYRDERRIKDASRKASYKPECVQRVTASGRHSVVVWGCITSEGPGPLFRVQAKFTADWYCDLLENVALPHLTSGILYEDEFHLSTGQVTDSSTE
ncbi:hypothetical protein HPB52_024368 [Rhipicephalus sanguineus]|uniref:Uncharacterized protein n=1 Tax=Rhipicephalus sanguineus TaxID=34632 RepID=A0A9D4TCH4_RHISA|nr:hypothetical protein HPB52_024368 [Rhipicephalus sanguineus]